MSARKKLVQRKSTQTKAARRERGRVRLDLWLSEDAVRELDLLVDHYKATHRSVLVELLVRRGFILLGLLLFVVGCATTTVVPRTKPNRQQVWQDNIGPAYCETLLRCGIQKNIDSCVESLDVGDTSESPCSSATIAGCTDEARTLKCTGFRSPECAECTFDFNADGN